jgi:hypothetical protein
MIKDEDGMVNDERETLYLPRRREGHLVKGEDMGRRMACGRLSLVRSRRLPVSGLRFPVSLIAALLVVVSWALAQPAQPLAPAFNYYVWGQVRVPGAYNLGASPDLLELLSAAGGPTADADLKHVVLVRATTQQRVNINVKKMLFSGQIVMLSPGDVVMVPNSAWYSVREYLSVTSTLVSIATLIVTIWAWQTSP